MQLVKKLSQTPSHLLLSNSRQAAIIMCNTTPSRSVRRDQEGRKGGRKEGRSEGRKGKMIKGETITGRKEVGKDLINVIIIY